MNLLPPGFDLPSAETAAFAMARGLKGHARSWADLAAHAQLVMTRYQELPQDATTKMYDMSMAMPLVAASRILDVLSSPESGLPDDARHDWGLLAMLAFGMWGNFLSASAVRDRLPADLVIPPVTAAIVATCTPQLAHDYQAVAEGSTKASAYMRSLLTFLRSGKQRDAESLEVALMACLSEADSFESAMLRSARVVLRHVITLAAIPCIGSLLPNLGAQYCKRLFESGVRVLLPPQFLAITQKSLPSTKSNSLVALHTSSGKTLLGELCLLASLDESEGLAVYVVPYVALGRQVSESIKKHAPRSVRIHTLVGGFRGDDTLEPDIHRELLIATPERFDSIIRSNPSLIALLRCVVIDEAHLLASGIRGVRLEGLLTRLRMAQKAGHTFRIVLLSAVTNTYSRLQEWLSIPGNSVITDEWRPTARRLAIWGRDGGLRWFRGPDCVRPDGASNLDVLGEKLVPWPHSGFYPALHFGSQKNQTPNALANAAWLAEYLWREFRDTCLCVCAAKHTTRLLGWLIAKRLPRIEPLPSNIRHAIELIEGTCPHLSLLATCLRSGVAYHNASLPHDIRHLIEDAIAAREIRAVAATTTLAEGVDLPFRTTLLVDWLSWNGDQAGPMSPLLFRNIAGRCGRAGKQTEGDTVIYDNPVGDSQFTFDPFRGQLQQQTFFGEVELEVLSVIETLRAGSEFDGAVDNAIASQFLAAIPENPADDDLVASFVDAMYWTSGSTPRAKVQKTIRKIASQILDPANGALATAASPFRLTEFGELAVKCSFGPNSCRMILDHLNKGEPPADSPSLVARMLVDLGSLPEQQQKAWRKELDKPTKACRVKKGDVAYVLKHWFLGTPLIQIFVTLPGVQKSKSKVSVDEWCSGMEMPVTWDDEFDGFVDWVNGVVVSFACWLMTACSHLSVLAPEWAREIDWPQLAEFCEHGVDSKWALAAIEQRAPAGREVLARLGQTLFQHEGDALDLLGQTRLREKCESEAGKQEIDHLLQQTFEADSYDLKAARRVVDWMCNEA